MGMDCGRFREMLDNYSDLSTEDIAGLEAHALECEECAKELEFMRGIMNTLQSLPEISPPADFLDKINERIDKEEKAPVRIYRKAVPYVRRYGALAACLAVGIAIGANGNTLVARMNNSSDGIIESTQTQYTASPLGEAGAVQTPFAAAQAQPTALPDTAALAQPTALPDTAALAQPTEKNVSAQTVQPYIPASSQQAQVNKSSQQILRENAQTSSGSGSSGSASSAAGQTAQSPQSSSQSAPVQNTPSSQSTASSQSAASNAGVMAPAAAAQSEQPSVQQQTDMQQQSAPQTYANTPAAASVPQEQPAENGASASETQGSSITNSVGVYSYIAPSDPGYYDLPASSYSRSAEQPQENQTEGYDMKYESESSFAYNSPIVSSIVINQSDEARVKELVDAFTSGTYGDFYMINSDDMDLLLKQMDKEGIHYKDMMNRSGSKITFRLVVT